MDPIYTQQSLLATLGRLRRLYPNNSPACRSVDRAEGELAASLSGPDLGRIHKDLSWKEQHARIQQARPRYGLLIATATRPLHALAQHVRGSPEDRNALAKTLESVGLSLPLPSPPVPNDALGLTAVLTLVQALQTVQRLAPDPVKTPPQVQDAVEPIRRALRGAIHTDLINARRHTEAKMMVMHEQTEAAMDLAALRIQAASARTYHKPGPIGKAVLGMRHWDDSWINRELATASPLAPRSWFGLKVDSTKGFLAECKQAYDAHDVSGCWQRRHQLAQATSMIGAMDVLLDRAWPCAPYTPKSPARLSEEEFLLRSKLAHTAILTADQVPEHAHRRIRASTMETMTKQLHALAYSDSQGMAQDRLKGAAALVAIWGLEHPIRDTGRLAHTLLTKARTPDFKIQGPLSDPKRSSALVR